MSVSFRANKSEAPLNLNTPAYKAKFCLIVRDLAVRFEKSLKTMTPPVMALLLKN